MNLSCILDEFFFYFAFPFLENKIHQTIRYFFIDFRKFFNVQISWCWIMNWVKQLAASLKSGSAQFKN